MKVLNGFLIGIFIITCGSTQMKAQSVIIEVPAAIIFNREDFLQNKTVMITGNRTNWDYNYAWWTYYNPVNPTFTSDPFFRFNDSSSSLILPNTVLLWQLESIGGSQPFDYGNSVQNFQPFKNSPTIWYKPPTRSMWGNNQRDFSQGDIIFKFKIPKDEFTNNTFKAGFYSINVNQNYNFTPSSFNLLLVVQPVISWLTNLPSKYIEVTSLNEYRSANGQIVTDLGNFELGNTVDFKLNVKASSSKIEFKSSKGKSSTRDISIIKLGSAGSELNTRNLSANFQDFSSSTFGVTKGNRNKFTPQISISASDFKTQFFEAGTYTFQVNFDAKGNYYNSLSNIQNTDVTLKVPPLAEISIPPSGKMVNFDFNTAQDYSQGQTKVMPNQLRLSNNENFVLSIKSDENYFRKAGVQTTINSNILQIGVDGGQLVPLSTTLQKIITGGTPVLDKDISIKYSISPAGAQTLVGKENATYNINVIYSFTAL